MQFVEQGPGVAVLQLRISSLWPLSVSWRFLGHVRSSAQESALHSCLPARVLLSVPSLSPLTLGCFGSWQGRTVSMQGGTAGIPPGGSAPTLLGILSSLRPTSYRRGPSLKPCAPPAALSFCWNKLSFQNQVIFYLPIFADFARLRIFPFTIHLFFLFITILISKLSSSISVLLTTSLSSTPSARGLSPYPIHRLREAAILKILCVQTRLCKLCPSYL